MSIATKSRSGAGLVALVSVDRHGVTFGLGCDFEGGGEMSPAEQRAIAVVPDGHVTHKMGASVVEALAVLVPIYTWPRMRKRGGAELAFEIRKGGVLS